MVYHIMRGHEFQNVYFPLPKKAIYLILVNLVEWFREETENVQKFTTDEQTNDDGQKQILICHLSDSGNL